MEFSFNINILDVLATAGIFTILTLIIRSFKMLKTTYEIREGLIELKASIKDVYSNEKIDILEHRLANKDDQIKRLTNVIQENDLTNSILLKDFIKIGIRNLDQKQKKELERIIYQQEEIRLIGYATIETLRRLVEVNLELENHQRAISLQRDIIEKEESIENYYALAGIYHSLGSIDQAMVWYEKMVEKYPDNAIGYYGLGACNEMLGSDVSDENERKIYDAKAINYFRTAIQKDSSYVLPRIGEAILLFRNNDSPTAIKKIGELNKIEANGGFIAKDYYGLACFYSQIKDETNALKYLDLSFEKATTPSKRIELMNASKTDPDLQYIRKKKDYDDLMTKSSKY